MTNSWLIPIWSWNGIVYAILKSYKSFYLTLANVNLLLNPKLLCGISEISFNSLIIILNWIENEIRTKVIGGDEEKRIWNECHPVFSNEELTEWGREEVKAGKRADDWTDLDMNRQGLLPIWNKRDSRQVGNLTTTYNTFGTRRAPGKDYFIWVHHLVRRCPKNKDQEISDCSINQLSLKSNGVGFSIIYYVEEKKMQFSLYSNYNINPNEWIWNRNSEKKIQLRG